MSQDLFAAFGEEDTAQIWGSEPRGQHVAPSSSDDFEQTWPLADGARWDQEDVTLKPATLDDDDDFGDFEDASASNVVDNGSIRRPHAATSAADLSAKRSQVVTNPFPSKGPPTKALKASPSRIREKQPNV